MRLAVFVVPFAVALALAGCATSSDPGSSQGGAASEVRVAPPVPVPAAAAKNVVLTMTGPKQVVESKDWPEFQREWRETFAEHARDAGIAFRFADQPPAAGAEDGTLLTVDVADYRIVGIGARVFFGAMTGNAYIDAVVRYTNLRDGRAFGEQPAKTTSSAWGGVFARVTPQQVDAIASTVFADLKAAR
ncbi:MAG: hypothetical protein AB7G13_35710 [Lautropia sp.]